MRGRETESWREKVQGLEAEKKGIKEALGVETKNIAGIMKEERGGWAKEKEGWKKEIEADIAEKGKMEAEQKELEEKRTEEKYLWEEDNERAQWRIVELKEESERLKAEAAEKEKRGNELEATRKTAEEEKKREQERGEEDAQKEAKRVVSALEKEVLNGRKLIEDLQSDKRRDRQLLLELRAQLVRPTHAAPPTHINPLRLCGPTQAAFQAPAIPPIFAPPRSSIAPTSASRSTSPQFPPPPTPQANLLPTKPTLSGGQVDHDVDEPIAPLRRPVVRLPPPPPPLHPAGK